MKGSGAVRGGALKPERCLMRAPGRSFAWGETPLVTSPRRPAGQPDALMDFSILRLRRDARHVEITTGEVLFVLLDGSVQGVAESHAWAATRRSLFDEGPSALHVGHGTRVEFTAEDGPAELAVVRTPNPRAFGVRLYSPADASTEQRGAGLAQGACHRWVRTLFDYTSRPESALVVGEVVNFPGRWSSYPPHHHPQPEIYHYRFTAPQGYGHAELGDAVLKVRQGDTVVIPGGLDHAQVSAPGYGMYYLWVVRHLPRRPYRGFKFAPAHTWLLDAQQQGWMPPAPSTP